MPTEVTKTIISDVIVPAVFNPYVIERTAELSAFYQNGILISLPPDLASASRFSFLAMIPL